MVFISNKISKNNKIILTFNSSQQLAYNDDPALATKLGMQPNDIKKYEVFVTPLFEGNVSEKDADHFKHKVELDHIKSVITQLLDGLEQLEQAGKCHNDIKPSNILLNANCDLKLCDFGLAHTYEVDPASGELVREELTAFCGSKSYVAPEVLVEMGYDGCLADIWSLGRCRCALDLR